MVVRKADTDIDIDFQDPGAALEGLEYIRAILIDDDGNMRPHTSGVYFQDIPVDPITNMCTIDSKEAEDRGYFKIDFLHVHQYDGIRDEEHLLSLMHTEPLWEMLEDEFFVSRLSQIHSHFDVVSSYAPKSVEQLAMILGMIRPAKMHLRGLEWDVVEEEGIWKKPEIGEDGYQYRKSFFKKPHAISYAFGIIVQMNLILEQNMD